MATRKWKWPFDGTATANVLAGIAVVISGSAAIQSCSAVSETRKLAYQSQAAQLRASAMKDYATAFGNLLAGLDRLNLALYLSVESPEVVRKLSDQEIDLVTRLTAGSF